MNLLKIIFFSETLFKNKIYKYTFLFASFSMVPIIYWLVYVTGGTQYDYSHTMYLLIVISGIFFGPQLGIAIAILGGLALGPLMPFNTITQEPQLFINWSYRLLIYILLGSISGFVSMDLKKANRNVTYLMTHNKETNLPNLNYLIKNKKFSFHDRFMISTIMIYNSNLIVDAMGLTVYYSILELIDQKIKLNFPEAFIIEADHNKLWFIKKLDDINKDTKEITTIIENIKQIDGTPIFIEFTIGSSENTDYKTLSTLSAYRTSDKAAKKAKEYMLTYIVDAGVHCDVDYEYRLISTFEHALELGQTFLLFQPKVEVETLKPIGLEALIRWNHPKHGIINPDIFIPLIESTRLVHSLDIWVLEQSLIQIKKFLDIGLKVPISINISPNSLMDPNFFNRMMYAIHKAKIPPALVELELTERALMKTNESNFEILDMFKKEGIKISLDDYGTGYTSLAYLDAFKIDAIKLDKRFLEKISKEKFGKHIIKSTINLAAKLGFDVIAEGVETKVQYMVLKSFKCKYAQGFYFAKPMNSKQIIKWYQNNENAVLENEKEDI